MKQPSLFTSVPLRLVGPLTIQGSSSTYCVNVPLATYETPLWSSVLRGARVTTKAGGIRTVVVHEGMSRSIVVDAKSASRAAEVCSKILANKKTIFTVAEQTSSFLRCTDLQTRIIGSCVFVRLVGTTGDASGHNMITKGADAVLRWICSEFSDISYVSVSGNYCTDKKVSSINPILGRGHSVIADVEISADLCKRLLKTTPEAIVELNTKKNLLGSIINGGVQSANAHFANMLLALYLATGQDAANIIEGSQGITFAECRQNSLYFSVSLPCIIVGTVGAGKNLPGAQSALLELGCLEKRPSGDNARRLAEIVAATVLCGELSLLAAQTVPGELVRSHMALERGAK